MSKPTDFEIIVRVLDDEGEVIEKTVLDYAIPEDELDLEDTMGYVSNDICGFVESHLPKP